MNPLIPAIAVVLLAQALLLAGVAVGAHLVRLIFFSGPARHDSAGDLPIGSSNISPSEIPAPVPLLSPPPPQLVVEHRNRVCREMVLVRLRDADGVLSLALRFRSPEERQ